MSGTGTRRERGEGGTRREVTGPGEGATRREDAPALVVAPGAGSEPRRFLRMVLPPRLAARFAVVADLEATGAEADLGLVEEAATGRRFVLKLYRRGVGPDEQAAERLARADRAFVVEIADRGQEEGYWYEVLEYCQHGSLRTLMSAGPRPPVRQVVGLLAPALAHVHGLGMVHRDLKPENVLVRAVSPRLEMVLGDFGLVRTVDASVRWTAAWGTAAYAPPESAGGEVSPAWDWWSLGMVVAELAGGRHPFELAGHLLMNDQQIKSWLAQRPVDLSGLDAEPRAQRLCQGLLTRDRRYRWGADQVADWLAGKSPPVVAAEPAASAGTDPRVLFADVEHGSPVELAHAFQEHWGEALRHLFQERDGVLAVEVERLLRAYHLDEAAHALTMSSSAAELPRRFVSLLAAMDPDLNPAYKGLDLTAAGLEAAALDVVRAGGATPTARLLDEIRRQNVLTLWRNLPGMAHGPATQKAWAAAKTELDQAMEHLERTGYQPGRTDWALARAWLLLCALDPEHHAHQLAVLVEGLDPTFAGLQPWWQSLRAKPNPTPVDLVAVLLTHPTATQHAHAQREQERLAAAAARQAARQARTRRRWHGMYFCHLLIVPVVAVLGITSQTGWLVQESAQAASWWGVFNSHWYSWSPWMARAAPGDLALRGAATIAAAGLAVVVVVLLGFDLAVDNSVVLNLGGLPRGLRAFLGAGAAIGVLGALVYLPWLLLWCGYAFGPRSSHLADIEALGAGLAAAAASVAVLVATAFFLGGLAMTTVVPVLTRAARGAARVARTARRG